MLELVIAFLRLLKGQLRAIAVVGGALTIAMLLRVAPPAATKLVIDNVLLNHALPSWLERLPFASSRGGLLAFLIIGALGVNVLATLIRVWSETITVVIVSRLQATLQKKAFQKVLRLPLHRVQEIKSGGAVSLLRVDTDSVSQLVRCMLLTPLQAGVQIAGSVCVLAWLDWRLLGGLVIFPLVYATHRRWIVSVRPLSRAINAQRQRIDAMAVESLGGIRVVRTFGRERCDARRFMGENLLNVRQRILVWTRRRLIVLIWQLAVPAVSLSLLLYGGYEVLQGRLTLGDVTMFLVFSAMLLVPLSTLITTSSEMQINLASLDRLQDLFEEPSDMPNTRGAIKLGAAQKIGRIELCNVSYRYPKTNQFVLRQVNAEIRTGETVALVGRSGSGKTTLCHLISRLFDPTVGQVLLDGTDLREIDVESYRRLIAIVEQDVFLFDGTIRANIAYARPKAAPLAIEQAARLAGAHDFVAALERGYDTMIGERGAKLSGGQRQRLAIARAVLADPKILILDEATSNLDSQSENVIRQELQRLARDKMTLIIAHRLSSIAHADRIMILEEGRLVEMGTHQQLISQSSSYREWVELQATLQPS